MGILAVILSILAVLCALFATVLLGTTGLIISVVLAVIAIVLAVLKRNQDGKGGIAAIVIAVLAAVMAFGLNNFWADTFKELHDKALEYKADSLWAQASGDTSKGLMEIISKLPTDDASLNALVEEMNELSKITEK